MEYEETVEFEVEYEEIEISEVEMETVEFEEDTVDLEDYSEELEAEAFEEDFDEDTYEEEEYEDYLTEEQRALVNEMNENGEMDYDESDLGEASYWHDGDTLENAIEIEMNVNPEASYSEEELLAQMDMQEEGLNQMTVAEYLDNYDNYQQNGRSSEGSEMQEQYREGLHASITYDLMEADPNLSLEEAERLADEELKGGAALHNPDQVAGGDPTGIYAYGSGKANSAMGSMWGHGRAEDMHNQILEQTKGMTREEMENTHLNIRLRPNKGK